MCYGLNKTQINLTQLAIIQTFCKACPLFTVCTKSLERDYKVGQNQIRLFKSNWHFFALLQMVSAYPINWEIGGKKKKKKKRYFFSVCGLQGSLLGGPNLSRLTAVLVRLRVTHTCASWLGELRDQLWHVERYVRARWGRVHSEFPDTLASMVSMGALPAPAGELGCRGGLPPRHVPLPQHGGHNSAAQEWVRSKSCGLASPHRKLNEHLCCLPVLTKLKKLTFLLP